MARRIHAGPCRFNNNFAKESRVPEVVQSLWIGPKLSSMEKLCIQSFLKHGHPFHLYVYDHVEGVPEQAKVCDANEIVPSSRIFFYSKHNSCAGFANMFRYKLLLERGGWWVDTDVVCLRPFDFPEEYVFSSELSAGREIVNCGAIKAPKGSEAMTHAWSICQAKQPNKLVWGETGPRLMKE